MIRTSPVRRAAAAAAAVALLGAVLAGCTKKITTIDPSFTLPEGRFSSRAVLFSFANTQFSIRSYDDVDLNGQYSINDTLVDSTTAYAFDTPDQLYGMIADSTSASGYQVFRREANGAVRNLGDFVLRPARRWLDTHWEVYRFRDVAGTGYNPPTYIGRGVVGGVVTSNSPLTNFTEITKPGITPISFRFEPCQNCPAQLDCPALRTFPYDHVYEPADSVIELRWTGVPEAAGYWIQVFNMSGTDPNAQVRAAQPAPLFLDASVDYFVAYLPTTPQAQSPSVVVGGGAGTSRPALPAHLLAPGDGVELTPTVFTNLGVLKHINYLIHIAATNAKGELVGFLYGDSTTVTLPTGKLGRVPQGYVKMRALFFNELPPPCPGSPD